jgi:hypothetical protein
LIVCHEESCPCGFAGDEEEDYWFAVHVGLQVMIATSRFYKFLTGDNMKKHCKYGHFAEYRTGYKFVTRRIEMAREE